MFNFGSILAHQISNGIFSEFYTLWDPGGASIVERKNFQAKRPLWTLIFFYISGGLSNLKSLLKYMFPVILFSLVFNLPKFFEYHLDEMEYFNVENNRTEIRLKLTPTELRLNANYVFYYINLTRFVVSGLFPFISLTFLHLVIYRWIIHIKSLAVIFPVLDLWKNMRVIYKRCWNFWEKSKIYVQKIS